MRGRFARHKVPLNSALLILIRCVKLIFAGKKYFSNSPCQSLLDNYLYALYAYLNDLWIKFCITRRMTTINARTRIMLHIVRRIGNSRYSIQFRVLYLNVIM